MKLAFLHMCIHVLLLLVELKERTQWPLGIVYVYSREGSSEVVYLGVPSAKLVLLVRQTPQAAVDVWVAGASAYVTGMNTTVAVRMLRPFIVPQEWRLTENGDIMVEVRSSCSRISLLGHHCTTNHCPLCTLGQLGLFSGCPWHPAVPFDPRGCLRIFCEVPVSGHGVCITGHLGHVSGRVSLVLCHVTHGLGDLNSVHGFTEWKHHAQLDWVLPLLPNSSPDQSYSQNFSSPFFVLPCDRNSRICSLLDEWGYCVRDDG